MAKSFSNQELNSIIQENLEKLFMILRQQGQEIPGCCFANFTQAAKSYIDVIVGIAFANLPKKILRNLKKEGAQWQYFPRHKAITMAHFGDVNASINSWKVLFESCKHNAWQTKPSYTEFYLINAPEPTHLWISELQIPLADKEGAL